MLLVEEQAGRRSSQLEQQQAVRLAVRRLRQRQAAQSANRAFLPLEMSAIIDLFDDYAGPARQLDRDGLRALLASVGERPDDATLEELFQQVLCWQRGLDYEIIALQAVTADLLKGDTIHHACGIPVQKKGLDGGEVVVPSNKGVAEKSLYWKWLLIDEFGMVGASLLAEVDMKLRDVVVDVNPRKLDGSGHAQPFGGLNVFLSGDLWQLPPPSGGYLANIPMEFIANARKYIPNVTISHGQSLLWGGVKNTEWAFHGITELEESERCRKDPWLQEVQLELREGRLSENSHSFLHGEATSVCGSWTNGAAACGRVRCKNVSVQKAAWDQIQAAERKCKTCTEERKKRRLVATGVKDNRFGLKKFVGAPAIFPNNDIKYERIGRFVTFDTMLPNYNKFDI